MAKKKLLSMEEKMKEFVVPLEEQPFKIPQNWIWVRAGALFSCQHGYAFKSGDYVEESEVLNCRMSNIRPDGSFDSDYKKTYLPNDYYEKYSDYALKDGDVIVALTDMASEHPKILGLPTIVETNGYKMLLNQRVLKITPYNELTKKYINATLHYMCITQFRSKIKGSGSVQINLKTGDITNLAIPFPPVREQQRIVAKIDEMFSRLSEASDKLDEIMGLENAKTNVAGKIETMRTAILAKAVRGELATNSLVDEDALEDFKEILELQ